MCADVVEVEMDYKFEYKCRLCGEVFSPCGTGSKQVAHDTIINLLCGIERQVSMHHFHMCNADDMGIADLQGVRVVKNGEV